MDNDTRPFWTFLLSWASALYAWTTAYRLRTIKPQKVGAPVICVGNLSVGVWGKPQSCATWLKN
ncbi:MAG: tetraacyldisaccharide 4'-kinase [Holosporaceae bacterium]|nr:MAG: tetraacyldisaccharide 4'-kinase [Holosporaceae bacterium]